MQVDPSKQKQKRNLFLKSSKGHFWPFFFTLLKDMERGGSYTYSTKILPAKPLTLETYYKKQSASKLAYLCVIFYQVYSPNVSGLRYWRSRICFWTHLVHVHCTTVYVFRKAFTNICTSLPCGMIQFLKLKLHIWIPELQKCIINCESAARCLCLKFGDHLRPFREDIQRQRLFPLVYAHDRFFHRSNSENWQDRTKDLLLKHRKYRKYLRKYLRPPAIKALKG